MRKAVLDVGSNSVLLLVEEQTPQGWQPIFEDTRVTSLGEGTKESGLLSEDAMDRTLEGIEELWALAREHEATEIVAGATMAARIARNTPDFLAQAEVQGTPVFVLSGDREAELGFLAVANDPTFTSKRVSIVDVGGQSTELVTAERASSGWKSLFRQSYSVGTLGLRGGSLRDETPPVPSMLRAVQEIDDIFGICYLPNQCGEVVTLGATGTNLISIRDKMTTWQPEKVHGAILEYEEVSKAVGWMFRMADAERAAIVGIERGRERTLHIGALILERALYAFRAAECRVSVRGWRHALLESDAAVENSPKKQD